jgi:hypothetical protein
MTETRARFVVKAEHGPLGQPLWLSTRWPDGRRDFVPRELAAIFHSFDDASAAIADVYPVLREAQTGIAFTVHSVE